MTATPAPRAARERAQQALESERLGYTEALGLPKLRERIGVGVTPERVVVTPAHQRDSCSRSLL